MEIVIILLAACALAVIAYGDARWRRISNGMSLLVAGLGLARVALAADPVAGIRTVAAAVVIFAVGFLLFWRGALGGGDVKLIAGATLLVGYRDLFDFLILTSLFGGVLVPIVLAVDKLAPRFRRTTGLLTAPLLPDEGSGPVSRARPTVPYGVAIAAACVSVLFIQTSLMK
jgi:prepilin peptidase CpaA